MSAKVPFATARRAPLPALIVASGLGSGFAPVAPGTFGTAACAILMWLARPWLSPLVDVGLVVAITLLSVAASGVVARAVSLKDPGLCVSDEFAGYAVSLAFLPKTWVWFTAAFFLFRAFDIWKPWPCRRLEHLPGGWGITLDDVMAGVYVNLLLQIARLASTG